MAEYSVEKLSVTPGFDFELFFGMLQETRIGGQVMEDMAATWDRWTGELNTVKLEAGKGRYLVIWLNESVEREIDEIWARSASEGYRLNSLALTLCMSAVYQVLPEVETAGCAPAPRPTKELAEALAAEGVPYQEPGGPTLSRRFGVLTNFPFRGACDICHLKENCPKANANAESFHSVEIPGPDMSFPPSGKLQ